MKPSEVKGAFAVLCLFAIVVCFALSAYFHIAEITGRESNLWFLECCFIPIIAMSGICGLWAWSSSNADRVHELELEEIELKRRKRRRKNV